MALKNSFHASAAMALLARGADPNAVDSEGETPLLNAVRNRYQDAGILPLLATLLEKGVDPNFRDSKGESPLHAAVRNRYINERISPILSALLDKGANPNATDSRGETPLHAAIQNDNDLMSIPSVQILLKNGGNLSLRSNEGITPLGLARRELSLMAKNLPTELASDGSYINASSSGIESLFGNIQRGLVQHARDEFIRQKELVTTLEQLGVP